jgi:hypothetical protein
MSAPTYIQSYGCTTAAGTGADPFFAALVAGNTLVSGGVCRIPDDFDLKHSVFATCSRRLRQAIPLAWSASAYDERERVGVILASTKGIIDDFFAENRPDPPPTDPLTPLLKQFIDDLSVPVVRSLCVSNACASSHAALFIARHWLNQGVCDRVIVGAVDFLGRFVESGFRALNAVTADFPRPFGAQRDGLGLGEAAVVFELSLKPSPLEIENIVLITEGVSLTRPAPDGLGLETAVRKLAVAPDGFDLILAHGTGTLANDNAEDGVFFRTAPATPVTGTKWCFGHTLGASGLLDLVAAGEILLRQRAFAIATTLIADETLRSRLLVGRAKTPVQTYRKILVSSLGFGGMNAVLTIKGAE